MSNSSLYDITDLRQLDILAHTLANEVTAGTILALQGELGSGKTTFTQHLLKALGITKSITSPTFTLINQYSIGTKTIYHLDLYRLKNATELREIGLEEILNPPNIVIIEWPELASQYLPTHTWWFEFQLNNSNQRTVTIKKG